jgi:hypothetical protein
VPSGFSLAIFNASSTIPITFLNQASTTPANQFACSGAKVVALPPFGRLIAVYLDNEWTLGPTGFDGRGPQLAYFAAGTVDPGAGISGFSTYTGRLNVTLGGNTTFVGLPTGQYGGQELVVSIVAGSYTLTLSPFNAATAGSQIFASSAVTLSEFDAVELYYDKGLNNWVYLK